MAAEILGPGLFEKGGQGRLNAGIATFFPAQRILVTLPGIHASQRLAFLDHLQQRQQERGLPALTPDQEIREMEASVDLFIEPGQILIRPDPESMDLAFQADELLQELVSKRQIRFLFVFNPKVQQRIKERGESWRISPLPRSPAAMRKHLEGAKVPIHHWPIYYYSRAAGIRYVTCQEFARLDALPAEELGRQLQEIADYSGRRNRLGNSEVAFFQADPVRFGARDFTGVPFTVLTEPDLRSRHQHLAERFYAAVPPEFRVDDPRDEIWRNRMFTALVSLPSETVTEEVLRGLSAEFFLQVEWLPGGRFEEGELMLDSLFDEALQHPGDAELQQLCESKTRGFIFNFIREYGDLEFVNVGRIVHSLSARPQSVGRRDVYIAELKPRHEPGPILRFIRLMKWGIREHLNEGKGLLQAILESEEYIDYVLDRRLGCRQLGMNLPPQITLQRVGEVYQGPRREFCGQVLRTAYAERDYLPGIATDKLPAWKYLQDGYALRLAALLGRAAASNLVVGRAYQDGARVVFDDGDEVVIEGADGLPAEVIVGDHSGAFDEYERPLVDYGRDYARPVNNRAAKVPLPREFAVAYLDSLHERLMHLQGDYRKRRRAFDTLFKHCRYDPAGSFAYRWECVLRRLDQTDAAAVADAVRGKIGLGSAG